VKADKKLHLIAGASVAAWASLVLPLVGAAVAAAVVGIAKEVYDADHPETHTPEALDALYTGFGGLAACALIALSRFL
jgi:hypothetical protein